MGNDMHKTLGYYPIFFYFSKDQEGRDVEGLRKGIVVELFLIFLMYMAYSFAQAMTGSKRHNEVPRTDGENQGSAYNSPKNSEVAENSRADFIHTRFPIFFGQHTIAIAFTVLYSYYEFEVAMIYIHFAFFLLMVAGIFKDKAPLRNIGLGACYFINIILVIASMTELNKMKNDFK